MVRFFFYFCIPLLFFAFHAAAQSSSPKRVIRGCFIYITGLDDLGYSYNANLGRLAMQKAFSDMPKYKNFTFESYFLSAMLHAEDRVEQVDALLSRDCTFVVCNDEGMITADQIRRYPNSAYFLVENDPLLAPLHSNHIRISFSYATAYYTLGATAAAQTLSDGHASHLGNRLGLVVAHDHYREPSEAVAGFMMGVRSIDPSIQVDVIAQGGWHTPEQDEALLPLLLKRGVRIVARYSNPMTIDLLAARINTANYAEALAKSQGKGKVEEDTILTMGPHSQLQAFVGDSVLATVCSDWSVLKEHIEYFIDNGRVNAASRPFVMELANGGLVMNELSSRATERTAQTYQEARNHALRQGRKLLCGLKSHATGKPIVSKAKPGDTCLQPGETLDEYMQFSNAIYHPVFGNALTCPPGSFYRYEHEPLIKYLCEPCPPNTHSHEPASANCTPCPDGTTSEAGAEDCVNLPESKLTLIIALSAAGFLIILIIVLAFIIYYRCLRHVGRSDKNAPKDPNEPFAIVFTDLQSSTALWAEIPELMPGLISRHHAIIRTLLESHGGYEVKTVGDSFMVAFKHATRALQFALDIQVAFYDEDWPEEVDNCYRMFASAIAESAIRAQMAQDQTVGDTTTVSSDGRRPSLPLSNKYLLTALNAVNPSLGEKRVQTPLNCIDSVSEKGLTSQTTSMKLPEILHTDVPPGAMPGSVFQTSPDGFAFPINNTEQAEVPPYTPLTPLTPNTMRPFEPLMEGHSSFHAMSERSRGTQVDDDLASYIRGKGFSGLRVRVGVHYGRGSIVYEQELRTYDYYGTVVNTAARVETVSHGGQVCTTQNCLAAAMRELGAIPSVSNPTTDNINQSKYLNNIMSNGDIIRVCDEESGSELVIKKLEMLDPAIDPYADVVLVPDGTLWCATSVEVMAKLFAQPQKPQATSAFFSTFDGFDVRQQGVVSVYLGDVPLRGLPPPGVKLYQLLPTELALRRFPPLRIDRELREEDLDDKKKKKSRKLNKIKKANTRLSMTKNKPL